MSSLGSEDDEADLGAGEPESDADATTHVIDSDAAAGEGAPAPLDVEELPLVKEVRALLAERGYGENDPLRIYIDVAAAYAQRFEQLHERQEQLANRQLEMFAAVTDTLRELKEELGNTSVQMGELQDSNDQVGEQHVALMETFERVLAVCGKFTPFLEKAAREIVIASGIIENRSVKAMILSYLTPAIALVSGVIIGIAFK